MNPIKIKVLAFGHLPKFKGGNQRSGLANAQWFIANQLNRTDQPVDVVFCATDVHNPRTKIDDLPVIGWTMLSLIKAVLRSPGTTISLLSSLPKLCRSYERPFLRTLFKAILLNDAIRQTSPDYIHLHECEAVVYIRSSSFPPEKTVVTIHGVFGSEGPARMTRLEDTLGKLPLKALAFVTHDNADEWVQTYNQPKAPIAVILNAYDKAAFYPMDTVPEVKGGDKKTYRLVSVGSVTDNKGQVRVVEAIARFHALNKAYEVEYTIVGDNPDKVPVRQVLDLARDADVSLRHVPFLLPDELREVLWGADFMILASLKEGFGLVFLESIASGTPIVLPRHLPICGEDGIVTNRNAVFLKDASADAILEFLLKLPQEQFVDADVASSVTDHDWHAVARQYSDLLRQ